MDYVEWNVRELAELMGRSKKVKAAIFSTLYLDLVEGLGEVRRTPTPTDDDGPLYNGP